MRRSSRVLHPESRLDAGPGSLGFLGLWTTQWTTAASDNAFRWWVVGIAKDLRPPDEHPALLTGALALFVLPYLFLAAPAGYLADRFPKRSVVIVGKWVETLALVCGLVAVYCQSLVGLFAVVGVLGCQSALFAPAKMGLLPEMMPPERLSAANGWFGLSTVTATLAGMGIGGLLSDLTHPHGSRNVEIGVGVFVLFAGVGLLAAQVLARLPAADPRRRFPWRPVKETIRDLNTLLRRPPLAFATAGIVLFWALAGFAQLNLDQFAFESGGFHESERTPLLVSLVLGVGIGCVLAGGLSRGRIEFGLLAPSLLILGLAAWLLAQIDGDLFHRSAPEGSDVATLVALHGPLIQAMVLLLIMGIAAGVFDVPLAAYLQHRSPPSQRGSILSAANFLIYGGLLLSALLFSGLRIPFHEGARWRVFDRLERLDPIAQREVDLEAQAFRAAWNQVGEPPAIDSWLEREAPPERQTHRMAALLWEEIALRRSAGQTPLLIDYEALVHDNQQRQVVKDVFRQSRRLPLLSARHLFLVIALVTLPVAMAVAWQLPQATLRFLLGCALRRLGTIQAQDEPSLPDEPLLLFMNRCQGLDRWGVKILVGRPLIDVHFEPAKEKRPRNREASGVIRIAGGPAGRQSGLSRARRTLLSGGTLLMHARPTTSPDEEPFPKEAVMIVEGIRIRCMAVFVETPLTDNRSRWSKLVPRWLRPRRFRFEDPAPLETAAASEFRRRIQALGNRSMNSAASSVFVSPAASFLRRCRDKAKTAKIYDSTGASCTGNELLLKSLILRRLLRREVFQGEGGYVALLLPPSVPSVIANMAVSLDRRVAVNLNYTASSETIDACLKLCGIDRVITSRRVLEKLDLKINAQMIALEDLRPKVKWTDKLAAAWDTYVSSTASLERRLKLETIRPDDELTVIFTSGSTGVPKGVVLTQKNVATNVDAIRDVIRLQSDDVIVGVLPFFHSFGYTVTLWGVMNIDVSGAYHYSPLDAKQVGKLCKEYRATVLLATPTFLRNYLKRCTPDEMRTLKIVVAGAEKLPKDVADEFERKFGVRPVEGYGTTELSPLVSVNVPPSRDPHDGRILAREGSVGLPISDVKLRINDLDTGETLGPEASGMLWVKGPNVMKGYLHREDLTREVLVDGWYNTGDVAMVDRDGFLHITGRVSRFSKIGGEMVPHILIEEALNRVIAAAIGKPEEVEGFSAVTAIPDPKKGERLIVLYTPVAASVDAMRQGLLAAGLPPLYVPSPDSFFEVEAIPMLGSGKLDLKGLERRAKELAAASGR